MRLFVSGFSVKQLLLVPLDILRNNFDFNALTEELFDFKGDSLVYSLLGASTPRYIHHQGISTTQCIHLRGVSTPRCINPRRVTNLTPPCIHCRE
jgi:hypothetical protein